MAYIYGSPTGYTGYSGPTGYTGPLSATGYTGYTAYTGYTGYTGPGNFTGYTGYTGTTGYTGYTGSSSGGSNFAITAVKTSAYNAVAWDYVVCNTSGSAFAITFPAASANGNKQIGINLATAGNILTLTPNGGDTVEVSSISVATTSLIFLSDGTSLWYLI